MSHGDWEAVIGLEIHVQLATRSKIFSAASTAYGQQPNSQVDAVTLGMPGVLPVLNQKAVEYAIRLGLALGCTINRQSRFERKHYFYPDLPKGYQISQYETPICSGGEIRAEVDGEERLFRLNRIHMEEDAGKSVHEPGRGRSLVDFNRAGVPLVETVSEPDLRSAKDAVAYMKALRRIVVALGVSDGNMEEGNFRCDANISVRPRGAEKLGTRTELKNINSFKFVGRGIAYEIQRQISVLEGGGEIAQETRLWDDEAGVTRLLRSKEEAHDYRYFPDPDLMVLALDEAWIEEIRQAMPELPRDRMKRFQSQYGLSAYDADVLTQTTELSAYFETAAAPLQDPKLAANWVQGELLASLNRDDLGVADAPVGPESLAKMLALVEQGAISSKMAKTCFAAMVRERVSAADWLALHGGQIEDEGTIEAEVSRVLDAHPEQVATYLEGKTRVVGFLVGKVMAATRGKANPQVVNEVLRRLLEARR